MAHKVFIRLVSIFFTCPGVALGPNGQHHLLERVRPPPEEIPDHAVERASGVAARVAKKVHPAAVSVPKGVNILCKSFVHRKSKIDQKQFCSKDALSYK